jgi:hypothetical protein
MEEANNQLVDYLKRIPFSSLACGNSQKYRLKTGAYLWVFYRNQ